MHTEFNVTEENLTKFFSNEIMMNYILSQYSNAKYDFMNSIRSTFNNIFDHKKVDIDDDWIRNFDYFDSSNYALMRNVDNPHYNILYLAFINFEMYQTPKCIYTNQPYDIRNDEMNFKEPVFDPIRSTFNFHALHTNKLLYNVDLDGNAVEDMFSDIIRMYDYKIYDEEIDPTKTISIEKYILILIFKYLVNFEDIFFDMDKSTDTHILKYTAYEIMISSLINVNVVPSHNRCKPACTSPYLLNFPYKMSKIIKTLIALIIGEGLKTKLTNKLLNILNVVYKIVDGLPFGHIENFLEPITSFELFTMLYY